MRSSKTYYLPEHVSFYSTNSSESLVADLSQNIAEIINEAIQKNGRASMAVSGGSTPKPLFEELSLLDLDWPKVCLLYTSPSPRDISGSRMPSSA